MIFRFADREVDDRQLEVRGPQGPVLIEPRVLDTLLYLLRNRERVVSKQELIDQVWGVGHVTDSAVTRCIMEARRALGDDGSNGRMIRTFYGRGYRFIASVEEVETPRAAVVPPVVSRAPRRFAGLAVAVLLLGLVSAVALRRGDSVLPSATAGPPRVALLSSSAVADFDMEVLALSLGDSLGRSIERIEGIELVPSPIARLDEVAALLRSDFGELDYLLIALVEPSETPGHARFAATLNRLESGGLTSRIPLSRYLLPYVGETADVERFVVVREAVAARVVSRLQATINPFGARLPNESEAWILYLRAVTQWEPVCGAGGAVALLRRSLELDPGFPPAWWALAGQTVSDVKFCGGQAGSMAEAREAVDRAIELDRERPEALSFRPIILLWEGENDRSYAELVAARERFPGDLALRFAMTTVLRFAGFLDESRDLYDEIAADWPAFPYLSRAVPYAHIYQRDWAASKRLMPGETAPHFRFYQAYVELMSGNREAAVALLEPVYELHPGDLYGRLCQALLATIREDPEEARLLLTHLVRQRREGAVDAEVTFEIARLLVMAKDDETGLKQLARAVEDGFFCAACIDNDPTLARLRADDRYRSVLDRASKRHLAFAERHALGRASTGEPPGPGRTTGR